MHLFPGVFRLFLSRFISVHSFSGLPSSVSPTLLISVDDHSESWDWSDQLRPTISWPCGEKKNTVSTEITFMRFHPSNWVQIYTQTIVWNLRECFKEEMWSSDNRTSLWMSGLQKYGRPLEKKCRLVDRCQLSTSLWIFYQLLGYRQRKKGIVITADEASLEEMLVQLEHMMCLHLLKLNDPCTVFPDTWKIELLVKSIYNFMKNYTRSWLLCPSQISCQLTFPLTGHTPEPI